MAKSDLEEIADFLWGKSEPYKSLLHHMIDAGICALEYLSSINLPLLKVMSDSCNLNQDHLCRLVGYLVACHDIGKAHPNFQFSGQGFDSLPNNIQEKLLSLKSYSCMSFKEFRHEVYSEEILTPLWINKRNFEKDFAEQCARVIANHHNKYLNGKCYQNKKSKTFIEYGKIHTYLENTIFELFSPLLLSFDCQNFSVFCEGLNEVLVLADWIVSDVNYVVPCDYDDVKEYFNNSKKVAKEKISSIGFIHSSLPQCTNLEDFFSWSKGSSRPMQKLVNSISDKNFGLAIIEDSPGSGKTEASLFLALKLAESYQKKGIYFALPTSATSNQMWDRINSCFSKYNIPKTRLMHGMAWSYIQHHEVLQSKFGSNDEVGDEWLRPSRRALLSQFGVGTVDQIMMAVLNIKFRVLRLLGLTNKVLVIDEVHAYDAYMSKILERLLMWCSVFKIPVILLSATLPLSKKQSLINAYTGLELTDISPNNSYPLFTGVTDENLIIQKSCQAYKNYEYHLHLLPFLCDLEKTSDFALTKVMNGGNLCLMLNTVSDSQKVYKILKEKSSNEKDFSLLLYHARFTAEDRAKIEKKCLEMYSTDNRRPKRSILVCTQVVEQSLDVDFDVMISQICPIDLLIQRMGREWRHNIERPSNINKPDFYILTGEIQKSPMCKVYDSYIIHKTQEYLNDKKILRVPNDLRDAIGKVYDSSEDSYEFLAKNKKEELEKTKALGCLIGKPNKKGYFLYENDSIETFEDNLENAHVATRLGTNSSRVILCDDELFKQYKEDPKAKEVLNKMMDKSLSIPIDINFNNCENKGPLKGIFIAHGSNSEYAIDSLCKLNYDSEYGAEISKD